jgi:hypothetical protein
LHPRPTEECSRALVRVERRQIPRTCHGAQRRAFARACVRARACQGWRACRATHRRPPEPRQRPKAKQHCARLARTSLSPRRTSECSALPRSAAASGPEAAWPRPEHCRVAPPGALQGGARPGADVGVSDRGACRASIDPAGSRRGRPAPTAVRWLGPRRCCNRTAAVAAVHDRCGSGAGAVRSV